MAGLEHDHIWAGLVLLTLDVSRFNDLNWRLGRGLLWPRKQSRGGAEELCGEGWEGANMVYTLQKGW